jgi:hypothetical protein
VNLSDQASLRPNDHDHRGQPLAELLRCGCSVSLFAKQVQLVHGEFEQRGFVGFTRRITARTIAQAGANAVALHENNNMPTGKL